MSITIRFKHPIELHHDVFDSVKDAAEDLAKKCNAYGKGDSPVCPWPNCCCPLARTGFHNCEHITAKEWAAVLEQEDED